MDMMLFKFLSFLKCITESNRKSEWSDHVQKDVFEDFELKMINLEMKVQDHYWEAIRDRPFYLKGILKKWLAYKYSNI